MIPKFSKGKTFCFLINKLFFSFPLAQFSQNVFSNNLWKNPKSHSFCCQSQGGDSAQTFFCCTVIFYTEVFHFWSKVTCFCKWKQQKHFHTKCFKTKPFCVKSSPGEFHPGRLMHQSPVSMLTRALDNEVKIKKNKLP